MVNIGFLLIGLCGGGGVGWGGGYMLSAARKRKGICPSAFQLIVFLWVFFVLGWFFWGGGEEVCYPHGLFNSRIHSVCLDLDYCPSVFDERSLRPQANERRGKTGSNGMSD